jgi:branched-chain amino acid transport system substrate-binding protein
MEKTKASIGILLTILMAATAFLVFPTPVAAEDITIGIMGPTGLIQGDGMLEGAQLAASEMGGQIGGRNIVLKMRDEFQGLADGTVTTGTAAMQQLVADGCDYVMGGFRTESVTGAKEVAADNELLYFINGAATDDVISCADGTCGKCVRCNYERYKILFRTTPINSTMLVASITGYYYLGIRGFLTEVMDTLAGPFGFDSVSPVWGPARQVKVGVVTENLVWADGFHDLLTNPAKFIPVCGPRYNLTYAARVSPTQEDFTVEMTGLKSAQCRLVVMILSAEKAGRAFTTAMYDQQVPAAAVGINVIEQMSESWDETSGKVEYECGLVTSGTRTPITVKSIPFWDAYETMHGHAPIYTAYGTYNTLYTLKEAIDAVGFNTDDIIAYLEGAGPRLTPTGLADFTSQHDLLCYSVGMEWPYGFVRALMGQWQAGKIEVVCPKYSVDPAILPYWKRYMVRLNVYNFTLDLNYDGVVNMRDISLAARAFGSYPCHSMYDRGAAIIVDDSPTGYEDEPVTMRDISKIARAFGTDYTDHWPLPYTWHTSW